MAKSNNQTLLIVESPAKASTIEKFLGPNFKVISSYGHIRDLPKSKLGVDLDNNYQPEYVIAKRNQKTATALKKAASSASRVLLASDGDREGEAIAWHVAHLANLDQNQPNRILFKEITKPALEHAVNNPKKIDIDLVNAQQARRILDRLVGYPLSQLLWKKVRGGASAGRVQSVAVRLIVDKEEEIKAFENTAYFEITAELEVKGKSFTAKHSKRIEGRDRAIKLLEAIASGKLQVADIKSSPLSRNPPPPFTTSTLQQGAAQTLGMSVKQTMTLAQKLYESGHITYMRTDSVNLSASAVESIRQALSKQFGDKYLGGDRHFKASKGAQEAHEAIRPTNIGAIQAGSDDGQKRLYKLIWQRTMACQMAPAKLSKTEATISIDSQVLLSVSGLKIDFAGFMAVLSRPLVKETELPDLTTGDLLKLQEAKAQQKLTKPPARYSEATLVKTMESLGIGRPSTYAPTISTIQDRGYVIKGDSEGQPSELEILKIEPDKQIQSEKVTENYGSYKNRLAPTDMGLLVNTFLTKHFSDILDYDFTADVEKKFDQVAEGKLDWQAMIGEFYKPFSKKLEHVDATVTRSEAGGQKELGVDPKTKLKIYARMARFGPVIQLGEAEKDGEKPKFAPFPKDTTIDNITLDQALKMLTLPRSIGKGGGGEELSVSIGRFGPYLKYGDSYLSIDETEVFDIDEDRAIQLIKEGASQQKKSTLKTFDGSKIVVKTGRFGPYVTDGKTNASLPKSVEPESVELDFAKSLIEKKINRRNKQ